MVESDVLARIKRDLMLSGDWESGDISIRNGHRVQVDGVIKGRRRILVEVYAHQGRMKGSQPNKLMGDAMKLSLIRLDKWPTARAILAVCPDVRDQMENSWRMEALRAHRIELKSVRLTPRMVQQLLRTQRMQRR